MSQSPVERCYDRFFVHEGSVQSYLVVILIEKSVFVDLKVYAFMQTDPFGVLKEPFGSDGREALFQVSNDKWVCMK